jgi:multisubunit Na+/H+ antiporter MnhC subunit
MEAVLAVVIGGVYALGLYLMMRRSIVKLIIGLGLLGHAANLLIFTLGRLTRGRPPLIPDADTAPLEPFADPLPQALILLLAGVCGAFLTGRHVQPLRLVRGDADRLVRPARAGRRARRSWRARSSTSR